MLQLFPSLEPLKCRNTFLDNSAHMLICGDCSCRRGGPSNAQPHSLPQPRKSLKPRCLGAVSQKPPWNSPWDAGKGPAWVTLGWDGRDFDLNPKSRPSLSTYSKD